MHKSESAEENVVVRTEVVLPGRKQRRMVIVENFHPDQEAMQDALEWLMRKGGKKDDSKSASI